MKSTGLRGDAAVLYASSRLVEAGLILLKPISECLKFDLGIYDDSFYRVQVKRAFPAKTKDKFVISTRTVMQTATKAIAKKYTIADIDFVIGVIFETNDIYCIPSTIAANRNTITLNPLNIESVHASSTKNNVEVFKNTITLHNQLYKL